MVRAIRRLKRASDPADVGVQQRSASARVGLLTLLLCGLVPWPAIAKNLILSEPQVQDYLDTISQQQGWERSALSELFEGMVWDERALELISRPAEKALQWSEYSKIFLTAERIAAGQAFIRKHRETLTRAQQDFGVPASVIAAIIGVETYYGRITGKHNVLAALATLGFRYPKRSGFFKSELTEFLSLIREERLDARTLEGSYAGAMGLPQFISSSYRSYAIDFDGNQVRDLFASEADAIGSVANYLSRHGWDVGQPAVIRVRPQGHDYQSLMTDSLKPVLTDRKLQQAGVALSVDAPGRKSIFELQGDQGTEIWVGLTNFYVVTRYNHSRLYAMAVLQLARALSSE